MSNKNKKQSAGMPLKVFLSRLEAGAYKTARAARIAASRVQQQETAEAYARVATADRQGHWAPRKAEPPASGEVAEELPAALVDLQSLVESGQMTSATALRRAWNRGYHHAKERAEAMRKALGELEAARAERDTAVSALQAARTHADECTAKVIASLDAYNRLRQEEE